MLEAQRHFARTAGGLRDAVEFFDPERYNGAATLQDNVLFGKIVTGQAGATERITRLVREVLEGSICAPDEHSRTVSITRLAWAARASC